MTPYPDSYYAASANPARPRPPLTGEVEADIGIVGAGYSGLSTALHLAEQGYDVALLEANKVGWGASGRNGGQIVNGLNAGLDKIERNYGAERAAFVGGLVQEGGRTIRRIVRDYGIPCDLKDGNLFTAYTAKHMKEFEEKQALWRKHGMDDHEMLDATEVKAHVASDVYAGGMFDRTGGHLHPLNLALGEAEAIEDLRGRIYEGSALVRQEGTTLHTATGSLRCKSVVLCGNAYLGKTVPALTSRVMPVSTQMVTTEPLGERADALLPTDICVEDARYILDYFRLSADKRLIFGGGSIYGGADPADVRAKLRPNLEKVFPQLKGVALDYAWSGNFALSFSRVPQMGRLEDGVYFAHGYSGHGVTGSHLFGKILAEAIHGDLSRFDVFAGMRWLPFPGGRTFGAQYSTMGSWWYGLRDRLGV
jgi:gamma-glutamylputrescine oxidase